MVTGCGRALAACLLRDVIPVMSRYAVVPLEPPPQYVIALAWRPDEQAAAARRCLDYLRRYRDLHAWISDADAAPPLVRDQGMSLMR